MQKLENIKSILIIRSGALGEAIFAMPAIDALVQQYGENIKIDWVGTPLASALFKHNPYISKVFHLKHRRVPIFFSREKRAIINHSKKEPYDILINLEGGHIFYPLCESIHARHKFGMPYNQIIGLGETNAQIGLPPPHAVESLKTIYQDCIDPEILKNSFPKLYGDDKSTVKQSFDLPEKYIIIAPSNSHHNSSKINYRAWPLDKWKELISLLSKEHKLVIIGNKGEESYFKDLEPYPDTNVIDLVGKTSLTELITVIEMAQLTLTTDTGPSHISAAVNTPTFTLIGPTDSHGTGPYATPNNIVKVISENLECSPCYPTGQIKFCRDNICMKSIEVSRVYGEVTEFLAH